MVGTGDTGVPGLGFGHKELRRSNQGNSSIRHSAAMRCTRRHSPTKMPFDAMSACLKLPRVIATYEARSNTR